MTDCKYISQGRFAGEPALEDVLADPIVLAVMAGDGLVEADLRRCVSHARQLLAINKGA